MATFNEVIAQLRKKNNLKQDEVAQKVGVNRATWSDYERGKTEPNFSTLIRIADFFRVNIDGLIRGNVQVFENDNEPLNVQESVQENVQETSGSMVNEPKGLSGEKAYKEDLINTLKKLVETQEDNISILKSKLSEAQQKIKEMEVEKAKKKPQEKPISTR